MTTDINPKFRVVPTPETESQDFNRSVGGPVMEDIVNIMTSKKTTDRNPDYSNRTQVSEIDQGEGMQLKYGKTSLQVGFESIQLDLSVVQPTAAFNVLEKLAGPEYGFSPRTANLLMMFSSEFYHGKCNNEGTVEIPLEYYMTLCGLKDRKSARAQINKALLVLFNARLFFETKDEELKKYNQGVVIGGGNYGISKGRNPKIYFTISPQFRKVLQRMGPTQRHKLLYSLNPQYNPFSLILALVLTEHQKMNKGKPNENRIRTATLLNRTPIITEKEVLEKNQSRVKSIMNPFIRDMNALKERGTLVDWHLTYNDTPIKEKDLENLDYEIFSQTVCYFKCLEPEIEEVNKNE